MSVAQVAEAPGHAAEPKSGRLFFKYTFFAVDPAWRRLDAGARTKGKRALAAVFDNWAARLPLRIFSTIGTRADTDFLVWCATPDLDEVQQLTAQILATPLGGYLRTPYSYLAMTRPSQYLGGHKHAGQEHELTTESFGRKRFLFVYPFIKTRAWYGLPQEERQRMMGDHFRVGHMYPTVQIHTGYSFGIDDPEFTLAFETDAPADFLELVMELRGSQASSYTLRDTPIFTCVQMAPEAMLDLLGG